MCRLRGRPRTGNRPRLFVPESRDEQPSARLKRNASREMRHIEERESELLAFQADRLVGGKLVTDDTAAQLRIASDVVKEVASSVPRHERRSRVELKLAGRLPVQGPTLPSGTIHFSVRWTFLNQGEKHGHGN